MMVVRRDFLQAPPGWQKSQGRLYPQAMIMLAYKYLFFAGIVVTGNNAKYIPIPKW